MAAREASSLAASRPVAKLIWMGSVCIAIKEGGAVRVAILIATRYINGKTGEAWPACETMAQKLGVSKKTVDRAIGTLVAAGHLERQSGAGPHGVNLYKLRFPIGIDARDNSVRDEGTFLSDPQGQECPTNPEREPEDRTLGVASKETGPSFADFEAIWRWQTADPRAAAQKAFEALDGTARVEAIRGAPAYIADCAREKRKQCFAKNYLAERRWEGFATASASQESVKTQRVWIWKGTPQWEAWQNYLRRQRQKTGTSAEKVSPEGRRGEGWWFDSEWPPGHKNAVDRD